MAWIPPPAAVAVNRFGLGARPGEMARIAADPRGAVLAQLDRPVAALLQGPGLRPSDEAIRANRYAEIEREAARARKLTVATAAPVQAGKPGGDGMAAPDMAAPRPNVPEPPPIDAQIFQDEIVARLRRQVATETPLLERLVLFWSNHFAVAASKSGAVKSAVGALEREAIRPHVLGRFADMLAAVETHPAMLLYLDNTQSVGPASTVGRNQKRGLNENLAREILELHTLGVDGGYSQEDVTNLARVITGWMMTSPDDDLFHGGRFTFAVQRHEPGEHRVLGRAYAPDLHRQGLAALADLARHPATARHLAVKLVRHFVADEPPAELVALLERRYRETDGDLGQVVRALVTADAGWRAPPAKLRTPQEFLIGAHRTIDRTPEFGPVQQALGLMGQPIFNPPGPNGWPDRTSDWLAPAGLSARLDVAAQLARSAGDRDPRRVIAEVLADAVSPETRDAVMRAESRQQGLALLLMSPDLQRR
ncbi:DUF1800 domain-containing protein [Prosthecomicrobium sp. N25]|uniref:DUF1800 domain-containing protein n=1 Tax=Prosthecomicrobium sp. N25 TaxID=3129254 RepID=UPI0030773059